MIGEKQMICVYCKHDIKDGQSFTSFIAETEAVMHRGCFDYYEYCQKEAESNIKDNENS